VITTKQFLNLAGLKGLGDNLNINKILCSYIQIQYTVARRGCFWRSVISSYTSVLRENITNMTMRI